MYLLIQIYMATACTHAFPQLLAALEKILSGGEGEKLGEVCNANMTLEALSNCRC